MTTCNKSFTGTNSKNIARRQLPSMRRWRSIAVTILTTTTNIANNGANSTLTELFPIVNNAAARSPKSDTLKNATAQNVALLRMLKKYGSGWQTRIVRAHRN